VLEPEKIYAKTGLLPLPPNKKLYTEHNN